MKHRGHHHFALSYPISMKERIYGLLVGPLVVAGAIYVIVSLFQTVPEPLESIDLGTLVTASLATIARIGIAYILSVVAAVPLAILATHNHFLEKVLLPVFDVIGSIPILAFFPAIVLVFLHYDFAEGAAIFILFLSMLWNIVFTTVGGLKIIPRDISYAARVFGLTGLSYFRRLLLPAIVPQIVTGSILAVGQGWNLVIVAEALHTYAPHTTASDDLFGVGSILVSSAANGQTTTFAIALTIMVLFIALFNLFVWQRLLTYSQKFRFD